MTQPVLETIELPGRASISELAFAFGSATASVEAKRALRGERESGVRRVLEGREDGEVGVLLTLRGGRRGGEQAPRGAVDGRMLELPPWSSLCRVATSFW